MKKFLSILLSLTMVLSLFSGLTLSAAAEGKQNTSVGIKAGEEIAVDTEVGGEVRNVQVVAVFDEKKSAAKFLEVTSTVEDLQDGIIKLKGLKETDGVFLVTYDYLEGDNTDWNNKATGGFNVEFLIYYTITVNETEHGTITADKKEALKGETVTIVMTAEDEYFAVDALAISGENYRAGISDRASEKETSYTYEMTMPACDVQVTGSFRDPRHRHEEDGDVYEPLDEKFDGGKLAEGFYLLEKNVTLESDLVVEADTTVNICLNSYAIDLNGHHIENHGTLTLESCDANMYYVEHLFKENEDGSFSMIDEYEEDCYWVYNGVLANGKADQGGAVYSDGSLVLDSVMVFGSSAVTGGGVYNEGTFVMQNEAMITRCSADDAGGVYSDGKTEIAGSVITENKATKSAAGILAKGDSLKLSGWTTVYYNYVDEKNSNLVLGDGLQIETVEAEDGSNVNMCVFVSTETEPTEAAPVIIETADSDKDLAVLHADNREYSIVAETDGEDTVLKLIDHKHEWTYSAEKNVATADCEDTEAHGKFLAETLTVKLLDGENEVAYSGSSIECYVDGNVPSDNGYYFGDYEFSSDDLKYYQKSVVEKETEEAEETEAAEETEKAEEAEEAEKAEEAEETEKAEETEEAEEEVIWTEIEEIDAPGEYKAVLTVAEDTEAVLEFTVVKGTIDRFWYRSNENKDILAGENPGFYALYDDMIAEGTYCKTEDGKFTTWDQVYTGPGTYFVKYTLEENDKWLSYSEVREFVVNECVIWYDKQINEEIDDRLFLYLGGKQQADEFYVEYVEGEGYTLRYANYAEDYLCIAGEKVSREPFYWQYDGGFYFEATVGEAEEENSEAEKEAEAEEKEPVRMYLADNYTTSTEKVEATVRGRYLRASHARDCAHAKNNGNGTHTCTCVVCMQEFTEKHIYSDGICTVCGANQKDSPNTGDTMGRNLSLYLIMFLVSTAGICGCAALIAYKKKH